MKIIKLFIFVVLFFSIKNIDFVIASNDNSININSNITSSWFYTNDNITDILPYYKKYDK